MFGNNLKASKFYSGRNKSRLISGNACYHSVHEKGGACSIHGGEERCVLGFVRET